MTLGKIEISGYKVVARIGCTLEERAFPQQLEFDITLKLSVEKSAASDSLSDTVDYVAVTDLIKKRCAEGEWKLIEKLASDMGDEILTGFGGVREVLVKVSKFIIPEARGVSCTISKGRVT